jgi:hypothetical protein
MITNITKGFHSAAEWGITEAELSIIDHIANLSREKAVEYRFINFFHPFVEEFIQRLNKGELEAFMRSDLDIPDQRFFKASYDIVGEIANTEDTGHHVVSDKVSIRSYPKTLDFSVGGPYAIYNWEIFYHIPVTIAVHLSKNQRFAEAQRWFHFVFNPLTDEEADPANPTARYWNFKDFREHTDPKLITQLLEDLADGKENEEIENLTNSIDVWQNSPFDPHAVAKSRPLAYQFDVVMKYIDNLIAWGDSLFRQFTIETLNEATQLYVLAANLLGERPKKVPKLAKRPPLTYFDIRGKLDKLGNILMEMENEFPTNTNRPHHSSKSSSVKQQQLCSTTHQLFFCIPENPKLLAYWDLVADRLFKIRHCMDIEGNVRQIPLFQPPIDPGMLVKAAAAGLSIGSILGGLNQPVSTVRFPVMAQKASELINEVKALGQNLLAAIEKGDAERLNLIRQEQELKILGLSQEIKFLQWKESESSITSLLKTWESAYQRYRHYQLILGKKEGSFANLAKLSVTEQELTEENFDDVYEELVGQYGQEISLEEYREEKLGITGTIGDDIGANIAISSDDISNNLSLNKGEELELNVFGPLSIEFEVASSLISLGASPALSLIPQFDAVGTPIGVGVKTSYGGSNLSKAAGYIANGLSKLAEISTKMGAQALKLAGYQRRIDDWVLQSNLAAKEMQQIGAQIITSMIREQITKKEYENHIVLIENAQAIDAFLKEQKFSNEELYLWMQGEVSKTYYDFYKLAFDTAKKAEATMKHELMRPELDERQFIQFNYWDAGRKGLLSGEALALDMKKMELAYLENNKREFEITKHISLMRLAPEALLQLKVSGSCEVTVPEWLFDMDYSGHYMRRIKSVSLSIPAVTGPHTGVHCTLSLQKSTVRLSPLLAEGEYARNPDGDDRFRDYYGTVQSIATSSAQNDNGLFEANLRDERFLPFEGAGAESTWTLNLSDVRQFDYDSISDVVLHMNYTARQGGKLLGDKAIDEFYGKLSKEKSLVRMFSLKHDFPNAWNHFVTSSEGNLMVLLKKDHFPYFVQKRTLNIQELKLVRVPDYKMETINNIDPDIVSNALADPGQYELSMQSSNVLNGDSDARVFMVIRYSLGDS